MTRSRLGGTAVAIAALTLTTLALVVPADAAPDGAASDPGKGRVDWSSMTSKRTKPSTTRPDPSFGASQRRTAMRQQQRRSDGTAERLGLGPREQLVVKDVMRDTDGTEHVRYDRTYAGLPVIGGDMVVHRDPSGALQTTRATNARITVASTTPSVSASNAKARATGRTGLRASARPPVKVVFAAHHKPVLAWQTTVRGTKADGTPSATSSTPTPRPAGSSHGCRRSWMPRQVALQRHGHDQHRALRVEVPAHRQRARRSPHLQQGAQERHHSRGALHRRRQQVGQRQDHLGTECSRRRGVRRGEDLEPLPRQLRAYGIAGDGKAAYSASTSRRTTTTRSGTTPASA